MDTKTKTKAEILAMAERTLHNTELLIKQCDSWLSEEEGLKNIEKKRSKKPH